MTRLFPTLGIYGLGQMGASLALAARKAGVCETILAHDINAKYLAYGQEKKLFDAAVTAQEMAERADLIVICVPPALVGHATRELLPHLREDTILTDIASVKMPVLHYLETECPEGINFIPGHPIAGGTIAGPMGANGEVFARKLTILTPPMGVDIQDAGMMRVRRFWEYLDSVVELMPADVHDMIYGHVSHLPHLISFAACATLAECDDLHTPPKGRREAAGVWGGKPPNQEKETLRRFLRLGESDPMLWTDIVLNNQQYVLHALKNYLAMLAHIRKELSEGTEESPQEHNPALVAQVLFPRLAASCLVATVSMLERQSGQRFARYSGAGFADVASPASEAPEEDMEKISSHSVEVERTLARYQGHLEALCTALEGAQPKQLLALLSEMHLAFGKIFAH
jgi:cyclohexadieny/prephenate dehydrogenase